MPGLTSNGDHPVCSTNDPVPPIRRTKIEEECLKARVILQRHNKALKGRTPLSTPEVAQLSSVIHFCSKLGENAKPSIEKWSLARALNHILRQAQILPDFIPPQIEMLLSAWDRNEYNLAAQNAYAVSEDTDSESDLSSDASDPDDDVTQNYTAGSAMRGININRGATGNIIYILNKAAQRPATPGAPGAQNHGG